MKTLAAVLAGILVLSSSAQTRAAERVQQYTSPDGSIVASIAFIQTAKSSEESRVEFRTRGGKLLVVRRYLSKDGNHGYAVVHASWTPNSQFFVYSLENSGGHSPWHSPVEYFSRRSSQIASLDDALHDAVADSQFEVSAPDKVTVDLWFSKKEKTVSLSALRQVPRQ